MPDLRERFRALDDLVFDEPLPNPESGLGRAPIHFGLSPGRRVGVAIVALALAATGLVFVVRAFGGDASREDIAAGAEGRVVVATYSYGEDPSSIYLMYEDGSDLTLLTEGRDPAWSPDGTRIAFRTGNPDRPDAETIVNVINTDGIGLTTFEPVRYGEASGEAGPPVWSPDGSLIAFDTLGGIYVMHADGTGVRRVSQYEGQLSCYDLEPSWSPDATRLVFAVLCDGGNEGIWFVNVDGSERTQVLAPRDDGLYAMEQPAWSPDGSRIAFEGITRDGDNFTSFLYTMKPDGTDVRQLTEGTAGSVGDPAWSPDGTRIAYTDYSSKAVRIVVMNADGSDPREVPTGSMQACCLAWAPAKEPG